MVHDAHLLSSRLPSKPPSCWQFSHIRRRCNYFVLQPTLVLCWTPVLSSWTSTSVDLLQCALELRGPESSTPRLHCQPRPGRTSNKTLTAGHCVRYLPSEKTVHFVIGKSVSMLNMLFRPTFISRQLSEKFHELFIFWLVLQLILYLLTR
jgi:hypothetical protein